uniref:C-type lectin domain-containing protein n=1 Tax=Oncorhynchus tshawytscha TaxID=74940 RepID=A0A8C8ET38_ONCTS
MKMKTLVFLLLSLTVALGRAHGVIDEWIDEWKPPLHQREIYPVLRDLEKPAGWNTEVIVKQTQLSSAVEEKPNELSLLVQEKPEELSPLVQENLVEPSLDLQVIPVRHEKPAERMPVVQKKPETEDTVELEKKVEQAQEKPVEKAQEKPVEKAQEKPVEKAQEKPVEKAQEKPVEKAQKKPEEPSPPVQEKREELSPPGHVKLEELSPPGHVKLEELSPPGHVKREELSPPVQEKTEELSPDAQEKPEALPPVDQEKREELSPVEQEKPRVDVAPVDEVELVEVGERPLMEQPTMGKGPMMDGEARMWVKPERAKRSLNREDSKVGLKENMAQFEPTGRSSCSGVVLEGKCYQFFRGPKTASDAEFYCQDNVPRGLASITSQTIHRQVMGLMLQQIGKYTRTWVGGLRYLDTGRFIWLDGAHWHYQDWLPGEPNYTAGVENCLELLALGNGMFNDMPCWDLRAFVCSHPV